MNGTTSITSLLVGKEVFLVVTAKWCAAFMQGSCDTAKTTLLSCQNYG